MKSLSDNVAVEVAKLAIQDPEKIASLGKYLPTIGRNVYEYIRYGEVSGHDYTCASLVITSELTYSQTKAITEYLIKHALDVGLSRFHNVHSVYDGLFNSSSGIKVSLHNPTIEMICLEDIACALSKICRFGGQIREFYSVAQHCCIVHALAPEDIKKEALLHDAAEAYLGDVIKPLKVMLPGYDEIESRFMSVIIKYFHLDPDKLAQVKPYDKMALEVEHEYLQKGNRDTWIANMKGLKMDDTLWTPDRAYFEFAKRFIA